MSTPIFSAAISGFLLGASLIIAIGAQNAFILRQGLLRQHVFILSLICAASDALLIGAGVAGLGTLIAQSPRLITVVTAGGVIFIAAATDNLIRAIDMRTGETLWQDTLPAGGQATPMTYEVEGRQYLVIMAGGHHFMETPIGDELIAYALPSR